MIQSITFPNIYRKCVHCSMSVRVHVCWNTLLIWKIIYFRNTFEGMYIEKIHLLYIILCRICFCSVTTATILSLFLLVSGCSLIISLKKGGGNQWFRKRGHAYMLTIHDKLWGWICICFRVSWAPWYNCHNQRTLHSFRGIWKPQITDDKKVLF